MSQVENLVEVKNLKGNEVGIVLERKQARACGSVSGRPYHRGRMTLDTTWSADTNVEYERQVYRGSGWRRRVFSNGRTYCCDGISLQVGCMVKRHER